MNLNNCCSLLLKVVLVLLSLSQVNYGISQDKSIGGKFGANLSSFYDKNVIYSYIFGYNLGLTGSLKITNHFYLQPEVLYDQKGGSRNIKATSTWDQEYIKKLNYLTFPILAKFTIGKNELFYLNTGPFVSYLLKATSKMIVTNSNTGEVLSDKKTNSTSQHSKFDFGLGAGLGLSIDINKQILLIIETRYNLSFIPILQNEQSPKLENQNFNLSCGLLFNLNK